MSGTPSPRSPEGTFKGIALFTPGGDLVYSREVQKRDRWHIQLCVAVQEVLGLPEPPHFLVPCYSATVDRYLNPQTQQLETVAEAMPTIWRYRALLDTVFDLEDVRWQGKPIALELCNPLALSPYREQFPELWENHDIVLRLDALDNLTPSASDADMSGYVFRLFIRGDSSQTEETLRRLYETLDRALGHPYTLKVIDVLKHPGQVEADRVSATPTLIRIWPHPTRRIVGEIDDIERITGLLGY